jgi:hypothetical protein
MKKGGRMNTPRWLALIPRVGQSRTLIASALVLFVVSSIGAGEFVGLEPGRSTRADAERVLGAPILEIVEGIRYDYDPVPHDAGRISVLFDPSSQIIRRIDLFFKKQYSREQYRKWFSLGEASRTSRDDYGNLVELYGDWGIELHYTGPDESSSVAFFSHVALEVPSARKPPAAASATAGTVPYLGVALNPYRGQGIKVAGVSEDSPAKVAGVLPDDIILELGSYQFYRSGIEPSEFVALVQTLPVGEPVTCLVKRGTSKLQLVLRLEARRPGDLENERRAAALAHYQEGERLIQEKRYEEAVRELESAARLNQADAAALELVGFCQMKLRNYERAAVALRAARQRDPNSPFAAFYLAIVYDCLDDLVRAVPAYREYLSLGDTDEWRQKRARKRLKRLTSGERERHQELVDQFLDMVEDEITKAAEDR